MSEVSLVDGHIDNGMSDAEIVGNLNDVVHLYHKDKTTIKGIPLITFLGDILDLINRLKAENDRLQGILDKRCDTCPAVITAIKSFAEKLKEKATSTFYEEHKYVDTEDIDNLVKEMTDIKE